MVILGKNLIPVFEEIMKNSKIESGGAVDENLDEEKEPLSVKSVLNLVTRFSR